MADPSRTASVGDGLDGLKRVGLPASAHQRHVKRLRDKLAADADRPALIVNERGVGYRMPRPGDP